MMIIKNANVFTENFFFEKKDIGIRDGVIVEASQAAGGDVLDAEGKYLIPGLTDLHFHGCMGSDFCDGTVEDIRTMAKYELENGVTTIVPATMTMPEEVLANIGKAAVSYCEQYKDDTEAAQLCGIYMEGPFISMGKKGAQNADHIHRPDAAMFDRLQEVSGGMIKTVVVAPEVSGASEFIRDVKGKARVSIAHTEADYDQAAAAFANGASQVTHLYNAMPPFSHRNPGVIGAAGDCGHCMVELICDGVHIHPSVVRNTFRMFGDDRIILISDSMRAAGMKDGQYTLGGQDVTVTGNRAVLKDGTIAGSVTNLFKCMRTAVKEMGVPLESAVKCASANPAKAVGIYDQFGSISIGKAANLLVLDSDLNLKQVIYRGTRR